MWCVLYLCYVWVGRIPPAIAVERAVKAHTVQVERFFEKAPFFAEDLVFSGKAVSAIISCWERWRDQDFFQTSFFFFFVFLFFFFLFCVFRFSFSNFCLTGQPVRSEQQSHARNGTNGANGANGTSAVSPEESRSPARNSASNGASVVPKPAARWTRDESENDRGKGRGGYGEESRGRGEREERSGGRGDREERSGGGGGEGRSQGRWDTSNKGPSRWRGWKDEVCLSFLVVLFVIVNSFLQGLLLFSF
jgi:hypothetical protein